MVHQRISYGRNTYHACFHHGTHRTGINKIVTGIGTVVYSAQHHVGLTREDMMHGEFYTVDGSARDTEYPYIVVVIGIVVLLYAQRHIDRHRRRHARLRGGRRYDINITEMLSYARQHMYSGGSDTVVIAYKYKRSFHN